MSFDARHPDAHHHAVAQGSTHHLAAGRLRPDVLHKVGETYAVALSRLQSRLAASASPGDVLAEVGAEVARLERLGVQLQEISRVLAGEGSWVTEQVDLCQAARQVVASWSNEAALSGTVLRGPQGSLPAEVNPAVLEQLLELALEYALHIGQRVELHVDREGETGVASIRMAILRTAEHRAADRADDIDDLQWLLFVTLAHASGMAPQRQLMGDLVQLRLALEPKSANAQPSAALLPTTPVAVGRRVLLIEPQEASRVQAQRLLNEVGMRVDAAASIEQVRTSFGTSVQGALPDVLLTGIAVDEAACAELIDTLRVRQPGLRVVELVDDDSAFAFSVPGTDLPARVGRHTLARTLVSAISQELDAV